MLEGEATAESQSRRARLQAEEGLSRKPRTVSEILDQIGFGWAQLVPVYFGGAFFMAEGAELQIINASAEVLRPVWGLGPNTSSIMVSVVMCGFLVGTLSSGLVSDAIGRRPAILAGYMGTAMFGALPATVSSFAVFLTFRFCNGVACGIGVVTANNYLGEMTPTKARMYLMVLGGGLFYAAGEIYACFLIMTYMPQLTESVYWRRLSIMGTIPAWLHLMPCYFLLPESPAWQCSVGRVTEAAKTLSVLAERNSVPLQVAGEDLIQPEPSSGLGERLQQSLISSRTRWVTYPFMLLFLMANTMNFGFSYFYAVLFKENSLNFSPAGDLLLEAVAGGLPGICLTIFCLWVPYGHKTILLQLGLINAVGCLLISVLWMRESSDDELPRWQVRMATLGCIMTKFVGPTVLGINYVFATESFPTPIRGTGLGLVAGFGRIGAICSPLIISALKTKNGEMTVFVLFAAIFSIVASLFAQKIPRETKGQPLVDELPPERRRQHRDTLAAAVAAPSGAIIALLFLCSAAVGASSYAYLLYGSQVMIDADALSPMLTCWIIIGSLQVSALLWWLGSLIEKWMSRGLGWGITLRLALLLPLAFSLIANIMLAATQRPSVKFVAFCGAVLGASVLAMQDVTLRLCISIESTNATIPKVALPTGALIPLAVIGLGHLVVKEDWAPTTHMWFWATPAIWTFLTMVLVAYSFPRGQQEEEGPLLGDTNMFGAGLRAQFRYAVRVFSNLDEPEQDLRPAPLIALMLICTHSIGVTMLAPWVCFAGTALSTFVIAWIVGEFLGNFLVAMLDDLFSSFEWTAVIGGTLIGARIFIVVVGWEALQTLGSGMIVGQFLAFLFFFAGAVGVAVLRRGIELSVASKGLLPALVREAAWARGGALLGLAISGGLLLARGTVLRVSV